MTKKDKHISIIQILNSKYTNIPTFQANNNNEIKIVLIDYNIEDERNNKNTLIKK